MQAPRLAPRRRRGGEAEDDEKEQQQDEELRQRKEEEKYEEVGYAHLCIIYMPSHIFPLYRSIYIIYMLTIAVVLFNGRSLS